VDQRKDLIIISQDVDTLKQFINREKNCPCIFFLDPKGVYDPATPIPGWHLVDFFDLQYNLKTFIFSRDEMVKEDKPTIRDCFELIKIDDYNDILESSFEKYKNQILRKKYISGVNVAAKKLQSDIRDEPDYHTNDSNSQRVTLNDKMDGNTEDNQKEDVERKITRLYKKMCIASGFPFNGKTTQEVLGNMLLCESLCVLSEHI
jgi:hypothetical protein